MLAEKPVNKKYLFLLLLIFILPSKFIYGKRPVIFSPIYIGQSETVNNIRRDRFLFGITYFNVMRRNQTAAEGRFEYRSSLTWAGVSPFAGISFATSGAFYGMIGFYSDIQLNNNIILTPGFAAGYFNKGMGIDLAYEIEFRTQVDLTYVFENNSRIGIGFYHISNGNFGESNPGAESFSLIFSIPVEN